MAAALAARWQPILDALGVGRPGDIGWIHGANTRAALAGGLSDPRVNFIEGDISPVGGEIIMAIRRSQRAILRSRHGWI